MGAGKRGGRNGTPRLGGVGTNVPFGQRRRVMELVGRHCRQRGLEIGVRFIFPVCLKKGGRWIVRLNRWWSWLYLEDQFGVCTPSFTERRGDQIQDSSHAQP